MTRFNIRQLSWMLSVRFLAFVGCVVAAMTATPVQAQELREIRCLVDRTIQTHKNPAALQPTAYARWCTMAITFENGFGGSTERFAACRIQRNQYSCTVNPATLEPVLPGFFPVEVRVEREITTLEVLFLGCTYMDGYPVGSIHRLNPFDPPVAVAIHHRE